MTVNAHSVPESNDSDPRKSEQHTLDQLHCEEQVERQRIWDALKPTADIDYLLTIISTDPLRRQEAWELLKPQANWTQLMAALIGAPSLQTQVEDELKKRGLPFAPGNTVD